MLITHRVPSPKTVQFGSQTPRNPKDSKDPLAEEFRILKIFNQNKINGADNRPAVNPNPSETKELKLFPASKKSESPSPIKHAGLQKILNALNQNDYRKKNPTEFIA